MNVKKPIQNCPAKLGEPCGSHTATCAWKPKRQHCRRMQAVLRRVTNLLQLKDGNKLINLNEKRKREPFSCFSLDIIHGKTKSYPK